MLVLSRRRTRRGKEARSVTAQLVRLTRSLTRLYISHPPAPVTYLDIHNVIIGNTQKREMRFLAGVLIREKPRLKAPWQGVHAEEATITINAVEVRKRISFAPFYPTNDRFIKTGSGQT